MYSKVYMCHDDETIATQSQTMFSAHIIYISLATIICARHQMSWIYQALAYYQLIC